MALPSTPLRSIKPAKKYQHILSFRLYHFTEQIKGKWKKNGNSTSWKPNESPCILPTILSKNNPRHYYCCLL